MKKISISLIITIVVINAVLLGACGAPPTQAPEAPEESQPTEPEEEVQPTEVEEVEESVEVRIFILSDRIPPFEAIIDEFEAANPSITITIEDAPWGQFQQELPVLWASDDPPDVVMVGSPDVKSYAFNNAIIPLDDVFTAEDMEDFNSGIVSEMTYKGQFFGAPIMDSAIAVYYNKDLFEAAGIEVPQTLDEVWTWQEFVDNVRPMVTDEDEDGVPDIWGLTFLSNPPIGDYWTLSFIRSMGEPDSPTFMGISPDGTQTSGYLDTPEAMEGYEFWQSLYVDWKLAPQDKVPDAFGTGNALTQIAFASHASTLDSKFPDINWGIMPLPYHNTPMVQTGGLSLAISRKSANPEAAKKFVQFVSSARGMTIYHEISSIVPARKSLLNEYEAFQTYPLSIFRDELLEWGYSRPEGPGHDIYNTIVSQMMLDIAKGADIEQSVTTTVQELDMQLEQYK